MDETRELDITRGRMLATGAPYVTATSKVASRSGLLADLGAEPTRSTWAARLGDGSVTPGLRQHGLIGFIEPHY